MTGPALKHDTEVEMLCPTCNARQTWSNACRRCKCDLSLLRKFWRSGEAERQRCLRQLKAGRPDRALRHARRYAIMAGGTEASPLVGACLLLCGNWADACKLAGE
ncbi:MAG: hypothetical protein U9N87_12790 [Planctomycetota bacterium]|nr:hypothetical protein [Planctomycetota bacterium]